ncbi:hypothetical protein FRC11_003713, partial [Ceratobasidium sp. 423]
CEWNVPANYSVGVFEDCKGDTGLPMGIYGSSTFQQGHGATPSAHPIPPSSQCTPYSTVKNGMTSVGAVTPAPTATAAPTTPAGSAASVLATKTSGSKTGGAVVKAPVDGVVTLVVGLVGTMVGAMLVL